MYKFIVCSVILSDGSVGEILVAPQTELPTQRDTLPWRNGEKHRFMRAYLVLDMCELSILITGLINHDPIGFRFVLA